MRSTPVLLLCLGLLLLALPGAAPEMSDVTRDDILEANRRRVERLKKDPEHAARLQRDLQAFWALPPERRAQLRQLDHDLHQLDSATQNRLWAVLERYQAWLERLPPADRRKVENAGDWQRRLDIVKELREKEWIGRLPRTQQEQLRDLPPEKRKEEIARLREEQRQRHREALQLQGKPPPRRDRPTKLSDLSPEVQNFVRTSLLALLTDEEKTQLNQAEGKPWPAYTRLLFELWQKYKDRLPKAPPLPPELLERARTALPDVPEHTLFAFFMNELTREEREQLRLSPADPVSRERVKEEFFKRHPRELRRLRQLDFLAPAVPSRGRIN